VEAGTCRRTPTAGTDVHSISTIEKYNNLKCVYFKGQITRSVNRHGIGSEVVVKPMEALLRTSRNRFDNRPDGHNCWMCFGIERHRGRHR
jgi:hypothetical protein